MRSTSALVLLFAILFSACAKRLHSNVRATNQPVTNLESKSPTPTSRININTASAKQLEVLPGIGKGLAERVVEHREKYGPFARPEHLIMVRGIGDHRFRTLRDWITVE